MSGLDPAQRPRPLLPSTATGSPSPSSTSTSPSHQTPPCPTPRFGSRCRRKGHCPSPPRPRPHDDHLREQHHLRQVAGGLHHGAAPARASPHHLPLANPRFTVATSQTDPHRRPSTARVSSFRPAASSGGGVKG
jgi:hypothetical protein